MADPDGHEIGFVDDESFRQLSQFEPEAAAQLDKYIQKDRTRKLENDSLSPSDNV